MTTIRFRLAEHSVRPGVDLVEVWYGNNFIGQITPGEPGDGPVLRIISKYALQTAEVPNERATPVHILEVGIGA